MSNEMLDYRKVIVGDLRRIMESGGYTYTAKIDLIADYIIHKLEIHGVTFNPVES